jgi:hypothetical protein
MKTDQGKPTAGAGSQHVVVRRVFVEAEGLIHLVGPLQGEHTLCGDAFDLASDVPGYEWKPTRRRVVTCPNCARVIEECRGVRTRLRNSGMSACAGTEAQP